MTKYSEGSVRHIDGDRWQPRFCYYGRDQSASRPQERGFRGAVACFLDPNGAKESPRPRKGSAMTTTNENQAATTMAEEELRQTAFGLCTDYLQGRGWRDVAVDGNCIVATDGNGTVLVSMRATMEPGSEALSTLDLADEDIAAMRRTCLLYLADHDDVDAIRHDVISIAITEERRAKLRYLVGAWPWAERM